VVTDSFVSSPPVCRQENDGGLICWAVSVRSAI